MSRLGSVLFSIVIALGMSACAASYVPTDINGFHPTPGEQFETHFLFPDMADATTANPVAGTKPFATEVCGSNLLTPSPYVLKVSSGTPSLSLRTSTPVTVTTNTPAQDLNGKALYNGGTTTATDAKGVTQTVQGQQATESNVVGTVASVDTTSPIVSGCSLKVMAAAVSVCAYKTLSRTALSQLENNGFYSVLGLAGVAAGAAALAHASGQTTTLVTAAAAGFGALATNTQKVVPEPGSAQVSSIANSGLAYLMLDNTIMMQNGPDTITNSLGKNIVQPWSANAAVDPPAAADTTNAELTSYGLLFNASISACTQSVT